MDWFKWMREEIEGCKKHIGESLTTAKDSYGNSYGHGYDVGYVKGLDTAVRLRKIEEK